MATTSITKEAFDGFHSGDHAKCAQFLEQIGTLRGTSDVKVTHNTLINDYYKSGCADPQLLLTQLTKAYDRARERDKKEKGRRKREEDDEDVYREDEDLSILRYNQALLCLQLRQYAQATLILEELFENIEPIDDFIAIKICFLLLELCLLQREPEQAIEVLAYLEKPNTFLTVMRSERPPAKGIESRASDEGADPDDDAKEKTRVDGDDAADDIAGNVSEETIGLSEPRPGSSRTAGSLSTEATAGAGEAPEGPLPSLTVGAFLPRHGRAPDTISRAEYRFYCLMYRARLAVALKNTKAAKKDAKGALEVLEQELRHAPLLTPDPHTTGPAGTKAGGGEGGGRLTEDALREALHSQHHAMVNVLKAYLEYSRQNVRKAMKLLTLCQFNFAESSSAGNTSATQKAEGNECEDGEQKTVSKSTDDDVEEAVVPTDFHPAQDEACSAVFFNNLGCIHFMINKPNLATFYFQKALQARGPWTPKVGVNGDLQANLLGAKMGLTLPGVAATKHWLDRRAEVAYNAGLQMLMCERPSCAFKCFEQCTPVFRTWPRLWLRLAECCIEMHRQSLAPATGNAGEARDADGAGVLPSTATSWNRVAARPYSRGMGAEACGGGRQLSWSVRGSGAHRRWLLTTARSPTIGRRTTTGDDEEGGAGTKGEQKPAAEAKVVATDAEEVGERPALVGEGALIHAAMCLRNVLVLTSPMLPDRSGTVGASGDGGTEAGGAATTASAGTGTGATPAAGAAATQDKAAAPAGAGRPAKDGPGASGGGGPRHQARDLLECEASLLEDSALVKMAYVCLCQHNYSAALRYSRRLLEKNYSLPKAAADAGTKPQTPSSAGTSADEAGDARKNWTFQAPSSTGASAATYPSSVGCITLGVLYASEALLLAGKPTESRALLGSFVTGNAVSRGLEVQTSAFVELERTAQVVGTTLRRQGSPGEAAAGTNDEGARALCGGLNPGGSMGGLTPPSYLQHSSGSSSLQQASKDREGKGEAEKEKGNNSKDSGHAALVSYPASEFPCLGDTQCMLFTNLGALHVQDGNLDEAERCCEKALQVQPKALAPLRTLVYILLRKNKSVQAIERLKQSRMQTVGWRPPQR
mmetsp:Transcript_85932/g.191252  ORF Transcript_85932/g.191252 Transcript_85932/m.191252 type:complete len:1099 (+) Transcript_85932:118-3414(+)